MKFYFCEKCGKRLTETDVASGAAKDKRLKGVFCDGCAVGVLTMETLPLTDDQAKALLSGGDPVAPAPAAPGAVPRRTSDSKLPPAKRMQAAERAHRGAAPRESSNVTILVGGLAAGIVLLGLLAVFLFGSSKTPPTRQAANDTARQAPPNAQPAPVPAPARPVTDIMPPAPAMAEAPADAPEPPAAEVPVQDPVVEQPAVVEPAPEPPVVAEAPGPEVAPPQAVVEVPVATEDPPAVAPVEAPDPREIYWAFTRTFFELLSKGKLDEARARLEAAQGDTKYAGVADHLEEDEQTLVWAKKIDAALAAGFANLTKIKSIELRTDSGKKMTVGTAEQMQVLAVHEDKLMLGQDGLEMPMARDELSRETLAQVGAWGMNSLPDQAVLKGFQQVMALIAEQDRDAARRARTKALVAGLDPAAGEDAIAYLQGKLALLDERCPVQPAPAVGSEAKTGVRPENLDENLVYHLAFDKETVTNRGPVPLEAGMVGTAGRFNGKDVGDGGMYIGGPIDRKLGDLKHMTIALWIKRAGHRADVILLENSNRYALTIKAREATWQWYHGKQAFTLSTPLPATPDWVHLAFVYDGSAATIYANGRPIQRKQTDGGVVGAEIVNLYPLRIGIGWIVKDNMPTFDGWLDDLRIYDRSLDAASLAALAAKPAPDASPGTSSSSSSSESSAGVAPSITKGLIYHRNFDAESDPKPDLQGPGVFGKAFRFNGKPGEAGGHILRGSMIRNVKALTVALWLKREDYQTSYYFLESRQRFRLKMESSAVVWNWTQGKDNFHLAAPIPATGPKTDWVHVAWTCDGRNAVAYVNGQPVKSTQGNGEEIGAPGNGGYTTRIGGRFRTSGMKGIPTLDGWMDDLRIYDRALSPDEIKALAAKP